MCACICHCWYQQHTNKTLLACVYMYALHTHTHTHTSHDARTLGPAGIVMEERSPPAVNSHTHTHITWRTYLEACRDRHGREITRWQVAVGHLAHFQVIVACASKLGVWAHIQVRLPSTVITVLLEARGRSTDCACACVRWVTSLNMWIYVCWFCVCI